MKKYTNKLGCFSPPVMLATFIIEIGLIFVTAVRYKASKITRMGAALLLFLALFQLAEYNVCGRFGLSAAVWSTVGFMSITALPPFCIFFIHAITKRVPKKILLFTAGLWLAWELMFLWSGIFAGHECAGNYAIFQIRPGFAIAYFMYYYFLLFLGIGLCIRLMVQVKTSRMRRALAWQIVGYLSFILPTAITNTVSPSTIAGLPSIMCGFAILYAVIIVFGILPHAAYLDTKRK